jgi:hypothetical protein
VRAFKGADMILVNGTNYEADPPGARSGTPRRSRQRRNQAGRLVITTWQDRDHCLLSRVSDYPATETRASAARIPLTIMRLTPAGACLWSR